MFSQIKDRNYIEQLFHSVARVMALGGTWGARGGGESKTLTWGFAMAPHRLRALVFIFPHVNEVKSLIWQFTVLSFLVLK